MATDVFYEKGYEAASLQDIADHLGLLKGSLYYYARSKEDLLFAVVNDVHHEGLAELVGAAESEGAAIDRLRRVIETHVLHTCDNLVRVSVFLHELDHLPEERRSQIAGGKRPYQQIFRDLIAEAIAEGDVREGVDPKIAALSILGSTNWVYRWFRSEGRVSARALSKQLADLNIASITR
ncbi:TetR/AcrR family transcriptional regulator [Rhodococcus koreensis]